MRGRWLKLVALIMALTLVGACSPYPRDPDHTLDEIRTRKTMRVGVSHAPGLAEITNGAPRGREATLLEGFASSQGATVEWRPGGEEELIALMAQGELDAVIGGITKKTPWSKQAGVTRPWGSAVAPDGTQHEYVVAVPLGENALVAALETWFDQQDSS